LRRVLVTGARGFIGRHCLPHLLAAGYEVHAISSQEKPGHSDVIWHQADLLTPGVAGTLLAAVKPSHLLHLAWYAVPGLYWTAAENFLWVRASLELLDAFSHNGGARVVAAGTCAEYDWRYGWCSEAVTPLAPSSPYGKCKNALRSLLEGKSQQAGLSSGWGRVFFLYGPHEHPSRLVSSVIGSLLRKQPALCSSGDQVRDFLHVSDVASAFVAMLSSDIRGTVNIASGRPVAIRDVVLRIGAELGCTELLKLGARPTPPDDPPLLVADVRRLSQELAWRPEIDLETGLSGTIAWWRERTGLS
jgi:nucleoside-diphosphate-sugar epimerase